MAVKYKPQYDCAYFGASDVFFDWARDHETVILLNGGGHTNLLKIHSDFVLDDSNPYPFEFMNEEEATCNGMVTSVGMVLPEKIYNAAERIRRREATVVPVHGSTELYRLAATNDVREEIYARDKDTFTFFDVDVITKINSYKLA
jgi:hypothetical protein